MRDPNRIDKFCDELKTIWHQVPDWRFGQLMLNFFPNINSTFAFYIEDEDLFKALDEYIKKCVEENA